MSLITTALMRISLPTSIIPPPTIVIDHNTQIVAIRFHSAFLLARLLRTFVPLTARSWDVVVTVVLHDQRVDGLRRHVNDLNVIIAGLVSLHRARVAC
jgi:hypothetical protein